MNDEARWSVRPAMLAAVGLIASVIVQQLLDGAAPSAVRVALAAFVTAAALGFGFTAERVRLGWAVAFAATIGVLAGLVSWWSGGPGDGWGDVWGWQGVLLFVSLAIAVPLFQTARDAGRATFPYREVHGHAWTDILLWFASLAFAGIAFALCGLLSELFGLIGLDFLRRLMGKSWFDAALFGAAAGGALGLLRERDAIARTLQRVVTAVLSVLAPVLAVGLVVFLLALPFTGLSALWAATRSATPTLLACATGAWILANVLIGDGPEDEPRNPVLRWSGPALAATILPLAGIAAIATGLRIGQHGFTPDRLWALVSVAVAVAVGLAYWVALGRGRLRWADRVRPTNLNLAFGVAGLTLFLALPIVSFNAISTRDQIARLRAGKVDVAKFDWTALAFDFGDAGRKGLARLAASADAKLRARAAETLTQKTRWTSIEVDHRNDAADALESKLRVLPVAIPLPAGLRSALVQPGATCAGVGTSKRCTVLYAAGATEAVSLADDCLEERAKARTPAGGAPVKGSPRPVVMLDTGATPFCPVSHYRLRGSEWALDAVLPAQGTPLPVRQRIADGLAKGAVEVRPVARRQVFVGGEPVGDVFE